MAYKIKYDGESDVLSVITAEKGKLSHIEEIGDIIVHFDENRNPPSSWKYSKQAK